MDTELVKRAAACIKAQATYLLETVQWLEEGKLCSEDFIANIELNEAMMHKDVRLLLAALRLPRG